MLIKIYSKFLFPIIFLCLPIDCFSVYSKVDISGRFIVSGLPLVLSIIPSTRSYWIEISLGNSEGLHNVVSTASNDLINTQWGQLIHYSSEGFLPPRISQNLDNKNKKGLECSVDKPYMIRWVVNKDLELEASISFIMKYHSERWKVEKEEKNKQDFDAFLKKGFEFWYSEAGRHAIANAIPVDSLPIPVSECKLPEFSDISLISGMAYSDIPIFGNNYIHLLTEQHTDLLEYLIWIYQNSTDINFSIDDLNQELSRNQQSIHIELEESDSQIIIIIIISQHNRNLKIRHTLILNEKGRYELKKVIVDDSSHDNYTLENKELES